MQKMLDQIQLYLPAMTAVIGLLYVVGLVVTNMYLNSFGIVNIELLKFKYISSGSLFVIASLSVFSVFILILRNNFESLPLSYRVNISRQIVTPIILFFTILVISGAFSIISPSNSVDKFNLEDYFYRVLSDFLPSLRNSKTLEAV
jgi:hypothetical protein